MQYTIGRVFIIVSIETLVNVACVASSLVVMMKNLGTMLDKCERRLTRRTKYEPQGGEEGIEKS